MIIVKSMGYCPDNHDAGEENLATNPEVIGMEIMTADTVQARYKDDGVLAGVVLTTYAANTVHKETMEQRIVMCPYRINGPDTVFAETKEGRTIQRFSVERKHRKSYAEAGLPRKVVSDPPAKDPEPGFGIERDHNKSS